MAVIILTYIFMFVGSYALSVSRDCEICKASIKKLDEFIAENSTINEIEDVATIICEWVHAGGECQGPHDSWQCQQVCELAIQTYEPMVDYLLVRYLNPELICFNILNNKFQCPTPPSPPDPTPQPNVLRDNSSLFNSSITSQYGYFLQIPDLHWDRQYSSNSVGNCGEPVCCRKYDNNHTYPNNSALVYSGPYGLAKEGINCDAPDSVVESMMSFIKTDIILNNSDGINRDNLDFVAFVGDAVGHDVYNQSKTSHLSLMNDWINILKQTLDPYNIPVFMDLGNHEGLPVDNFGGPEVDSWFNEPVGGWMSQWIDTNFSVSYDDLKPSEVMSYSSYYTSLIRPGFRVIALNTGFIAGDNYYLTFTQYKDPYIDLGGQYKWLNETLYKSKMLDETVVMILHHPLTSALEQFQTSYYDLYEQYQDIIMIYLAGHTHDDHFHSYGMDSFSDNANNKPFATWFSCGSVTTYGGKNPAFRVYKYDKYSNELVNFFHYRFNVTQSNEENKPIWYKAYDAVTEYGIKDISPQSLVDYAYSLGSNDTLWKSFEYNYNNGVSHGEMDRNATICQLLTATNQQYDECRKNDFETSMTSQQFQDLYWGNN